MIHEMFDGPALFFTVPALLGSVVFLVKLGLMTVGGCGDVDVDVDADVDLDVDASDSTAAFKVLSIHSIATFIMGFGWGGLIGLLTFEWSVPASVAAGLGFGAALMWLLGILLKAVYDLQTSGNIHPRDAIGCEGTVYATIPEAGRGRGQVRVIVSERARIYNAVSDGDPLPTNASVRVIDVHGESTLTVVPA